MRNYDHRRIEKKWQEAWNKAKLYQTPDSAPDKENFYLLVEFPYPSGNLHVGHWYAFAVPDILARFLRMKGKNVLYPIGFDAFGLPAENAAIKNKVNPRTWTEQNIEYMKKQIESMGTSFDMSRQVSTIDPAYYKWTQWLFLQLFKAKLAYQKETAVNWCPQDKTVLANEQVIDGRCERCDSQVEQRQMLQWNLKITDYADRLIDDLESLNWPEEIKESQRNWIGRSEGAEIDFPLDIGGKKYKYVILHGFTGTPDVPRWKWLRSELENMGHEVVIPALPNTDNPSEDEQVAAALAATDYDGNTVLMGHSLGGVVAMKVVEKLKQPIARLVLVGTAPDPHFKDKPRNFQNTFTWQFDSKKIHKSAPVIQILHDPRDYAISDEQVTRLEQLLGVKAVLGRSNEPHFTGDKEPDILMWLRPTIRVFTTTPVNFGATFVVLAPEHPWVTAALRHKAVIENNDAVAAYVEQATRKTALERQENKEKTGVEIKGVKAINHVTGERIPVWVADFALANVGTGAVQGCPGHDVRDFEFAKKYNLPIKRVVVGEDGDTGEVVAPAQIVAKGTHGTMINSDFLDGMEFAAAMEKTKDYFAERGWGRRVTKYRLRDWIVSRQRYWGVPIPIVHCEKCGEVAVPDDQLPVLLPDVEDYLPTGDGKSPLAKVKSFVETTCPQCGGEGKRETDTFDTFVDSSWYFLRYTDPKNSEQFAENSKQKNWMPIDLYSGGAEHTTMHVLYSRFWHKALFDLGLVADAEPYTRRMSHGIILGPDHQKMSKSRGNVIDPDAVVENLGADTVRLYLAFIGPYNEAGTYPWNPDGVVGVRRFLERLWRAQEYVQKGDVDVLQNILHKSIKKVGDDTAMMKFNTAISQLMIFLNALEKEKRIGETQWKILLTLVAPFAPHMTEELWSVTGGKEFVHTQPWPVYDAKLLIENQVNIAIQIDGKTRGEIRLAMSTDKAEVERAAREAVLSRLEGAKIARTIIVPNRLINFVLEK
ncbi:MAG TPA: leucine--tRNA ligase [Candidatus Paceibacterota bacterium]